MMFEAPKLDDRTFDDLMSEARRRIALYSPEWTDHNPSDPGITLLELFAWMTDIVLYRLNRVPDKHYIKLMELIGMRLRDAEPARVPVTFLLSAPQPNTITIPQGTEVSTRRTESEEAIVFTSDNDADIRVPIMRHVLTAAADGYLTHPMRPDAQRVYDEAPFDLFRSDPPAEDDMLYLGFENDLSHHVIELAVEVTAAQGAGIDPKNPPREWEVLTDDLDAPWQSVEVEANSDTTAGFNQSGAMRLWLPELQASVVNERRAYWLRCRHTPNEGRYGVSPRLSRLAVASWGITVDTTNVTASTNEVLGRSDGTPGQIFELAHWPVVPRLPGEYLLVRDEDGRETRWQEVSDFADSTKDDHHYMLDNKTGTIRLAPALPQRDGSIRRYGAIPPKGSIVVMRGYRYGGGTQGNIAKQTITVAKSSLPYIAEVTNRQAAVGGLNTEDLDDAKLRVPGHLRSLQRAVTAGDFVYLTQEADPGRVGRVHCLTPPNVAAGEIKILVVPTIPALQRSAQIVAESLNLPEDSRNRIQLYLDERRLISTRLEVTTPQYQWVKVNVRLRASSFADNADVQRAVQGKLFEFINPLIGGVNGQGWPFGRALYESDIVAVLLSVPGVDFIRTVTIYPMTPDGGQFVPGEATPELPIPADGILVSVDHEVLVD